MGFSLEYDSSIWDVQDQAANGIVLAAGQGSVLVIVEGFKASSGAPKALVQQKVKSLGDAIIGLTEETDPARQPPGKPIVGHRQGYGVVLNGTLNTPQGPGANVDVVVLAATDSKVSIRVTLVTDDTIRDPAFAVTDSLLNSILWPGENQ